MVKSCKNTQNLANSASSAKRSGNNKQISASKHWCFTYNNYKKEDILKIVQTSREYIVRYVFQEEIGEAGEKEDNEGTPHLQGYIEFKKRERPMNHFKELLGLKKGERWIHWSKTRNIKASIKYCQKEYTRSGDTFYRGIERPYSLSIRNWQPWMYSILGVVDAEPDERKIHWVWEPEGNRGKTIFSKWLYLNRPKVLVLSGKAADMKHAIVQYIQTNNTHPRTILINVPRSKLEFISYTGLEEVKDMFFFSGKYEGGMVCGPNPHIIVMANAEPEREKMSDDRWRVIKI